MCKRFIAAALLAAVIGFGVSSDAHAANTTNFSDQWWIVNEAGWGASVHQQNGILFVVLFVYGADNKPTWFVAAADIKGATAEGYLVFSGDLFQTSGPHFVGPFNPASVTETNVGTLTFVAETVTNATLYYNVNGTNVVKAVVRQFFAYENLAGNFHGGLILDYGNCTDPASNVHAEELGTLQITHDANNALGMGFNHSTGGACAFTGNYTQAGHVGSATGTYTYAGGLAGSMTLFELERTISGLTGRLAGTTQACQFSGRIGGVLR